MPLLYTRYTGRFPAAQPPSALGCETWKTSPSNSHAGLAHDAAFGSIRRIEVRALRRKRSAEEAAGRTRSGLRSRVDIDPFARARPADERAVVELGDLVGDDGDEVVLPATSAKPTTWPASFRAVARLSLPPSVPRSVRAPPMNRNARAASVPVGGCHPTTWPVPLMAAPKVVLLGGPKVRAAV